jgi:hypothetical protein
MKVIARRQLLPAEAKRILERYLARHSPSGAVRVYLETIKAALK